jgi:hypothetical protein
MHTSRMLAIFYMPKWNELCSVVSCSFWNVDTIFLCSCIMKIDNETSISDYQRQIQHFLQGDLGHRLGSQFVLKNLSYYALVEGQQSWRLLLSTVILIVTSSKPTILYESSILSSPPTVDITLILFHVVSRACIVRWNVHAPHRVSPLTLDITLILVHGVSVACLMRMYISSIKTFPPYFRHYIDFVHVVFSCLLFHKLPVRLFEMRYTWIWEDH